MALCTAVCSICKSWADDQSSWWYQAFVNRVRLFMDLKRINWNLRSLVGLKVELGWKIFAISEELELIVQLHHMCLVKRTPCQSRFHFGGGKFRSLKSPPTVIMYVYCKFCLSVIVRNMRTYHYRRLWGQTAVLTIKVSCHDIAAVFKICESWANIKIWLVVPKVFTNRVRSLMTRTRINCNLWSLIGFKVKLG